MPTAPQFRQAAHEIEEQRAELARVRSKLAEDQNAVPIEGTTLRVDVQTRYEEVIEMSTTAEHGLDAKIQWLLDMERECFVYSALVDEYYRTHMSDFIIEPGPDPEWPVPDVRTQTIGPGGCTGPGPWEPRIPGRDHPDFPQPPYPWVEASWIG